MARTIIKLPESELEVMQAIWELYENGERAISAGLIVKKLFIDDKVGLICALVNDDKLTHDELEAIKAVIEKNENK